MLHTVALGLLASAFLVPAGLAPPPSTIEVFLAPETVLLNLGEDRRGQIPIGVKAEGEGFVCPRGAMVTVDTFLHYDDAFAGASVNPRSSSVRIDAPGPVTAEETYVGTPLTLDVFWGEAAPHGHVETYTVRTITRFEIGPCLPAPQMVEAVVTVQATYP